MSLRAAGNRLIEAGPAASGVEFGARCEKRRAASGADICAVFFCVPVFTGERRLSAFLAHDPELHRAEVFLPLQFGLLDLLFVGHIHSRSTLFISVDEVIRRKFQRTCNVWSTITMKTV